MIDIELKTLLEKKGYVNTMQVIRHLVLAELHNDVELLMTAVDICDDMFNKIVGGDSSRWDGAYIFNFYMLEDDVNPLINEFYALCEKKHRKAFDLTELLKVEFILKESSVAEFIEMKYKENFGRDLRDNKRRTSQAQQVAMGAILVEPPHYIQYPNIPTPPPNIPTPQQAEGGNVRDECR